LDGGSWKEGMLDLLPLVDTAICSADFRAPGHATEDALAGFLHSCGIARVAITRGANGIRYYEGTAAGEIPVPQVEAVDTTGAGDILHGAFCYASCQPGATFRGALEWAAQVASESCRHFGTRQWMKGWRAPSRTDRLES
jgi:sugar/nucleoside kinase (ribokinase family)